MLKYINGRMGKWHKCKQNVMSMKSTACLEHAWTQTDSATCWSFSCTQHFHVLASSVRTGSNVWDHRDLACRSVAPVACQPEVKQSDLSGWRDRPAARGRGLQRYCWTMHQRFANSSEIPFHSPWPGKQANTGFSDLTWFKKLVQVCICIFLEVFWKLFLSSDAQAGLQFSSQCSRLYRFRCSHRFLPPFSRRWIVTPAIRNGQLTLCNNPLHKVRRKTWQTRITDIKAYQSQVPHILPFTSISSLPWGLWNF